MAPVPFTLYIAAGTAAQTLPLADAWGYPEYVATFTKRSTKKLSREQLQALERAVRRVEPVALSAISLLEIAILAGDGSRLAG